ncbi:MAG TPA: orotate phosphoribosyltransferase [Saprospiraceae bacterium]|nr:orotate phosphoribosyltransferase [Saprospiraceae bacterium]
MRFNKLNLIAKNISDRLLQIKAIKLNAQNPFTWASGLRSPIYCDNRLILSYPEVRKEVILALTRQAKTLGPTAIAGVATAGIAWGAYVADKLELPYCYIRSKPKDHGLKNLIEGQIPEGSKVLVIEDLISTGGSSLEAVQAVIDQNLETIGVLSIFQYGFAAAKENFEKKSQSFWSLTDFPTLLEQALLSSYINPDDFQKLKNWNQNPKLWSDQFSHN